MACLSFPGLYGTTRSGIKRNPLSDRRQDRGPGAGGGLRWPSSPNRPRRRQKTQLLTTPSATLRMHLTSRQRWIRLRQLSHGLCLTRPWWKGYKVWKPGSVSWSFFTSIAHRDTGCANIHAGIVPGNHSRLSEGGWERLDCPRIGRYQRHTGARLKTPIVGKAKSIPVVISRET
jgi:hypothetical protein